MNKMDLKRNSKDIQTIQGSEKEAKKIDRALQAVRYCEKNLKTSAILSSACSGQRLMNIYSFRE